MAKKSTVKIYCKYYSGLITDMPQEAKDKLKEEKPNVYKQLFEKEK